ncbi:hypothetical protein FSP39_000692 [Pinctada imbricata]|uniref:Uncharacterized protein n=1 Tax=Pinctada imbricata TaxID=66713 RepID=A0AA89BZK2_PINIB|nr:hypothetical protein FSP39_000692 [Pinctada imbricata]
MALMQVSLLELLEMKDEMLKHALPPPLLIKLATVTGKVFRSVSDLNMPVNELVRLVRVYSTPWEEKSAALKKLHEDYESKQRQLNIAVKRLQLVDAHSKRIAREKRIMNWEKLFAKIMSNKGHGRRWKFLIETIKQKAKLGLEHVQEYTKQLEESSDEEEDEEDDDMPMTLKGRGEGSDKLSDLEEGEEDEEKESGTQEKASSEDDDNKMELEEVEEEVPRQGSPKKVRFASPEEPPKAVYVKPPSQDVETSTAEPDYDNYLFIRVYKPTKIEEIDLKCVITFGEQIKKTKRLDIPLEDFSEQDKAEDSKPKGKGLIGMRAKGAPTEVCSCTYLFIYRYEELEFDISEYYGKDYIWRKGKENEPKELKISLHNGPTEEMFAMGTVDFGDLNEIDMKTVYLPEPHGDDDVPRPPDDLGSNSDDVDIEHLLPQDEPTGTKDYEPPVEKHEILKKVEPQHFPIYYLNPKKNVHEAAGMLPLVIYLGKRAKPFVWNRQCGTMTFNDLMFDVAGIDITSWKREDMFKETESRCSVSHGVATRGPGQGRRRKRSLRRSLLRRRCQYSRLLYRNLRNKKHQNQRRYVLGIDMVTKVEYEQLVEKHSEELQLVQSEYEKRLQELMENLQQMQQAQLEQKERLMKQPTPPPVAKPASAGSRKSSASAGRRSASLPATTATPPNINVPQQPLPDVHDIALAPKTPGTFQDSMPAEEQILHYSGPDPAGYAKKKPFRVGKPLPNWGDSVPNDFLSRLAWFEEASKRRQEEVYERTMRQVKEDIEKKLAGQHKLSRKEEEAYDAMKDVSLPALFMPTKMNAVFNPRAHQYFHPTGSTDVRLSQPPSVFQLPPLPHKSVSFCRLKRMSVVNLFELSRNFARKEEQWLMARYLQQQEPVDNVHGTVPQTPAPTVAPQVAQSIPQTPYNDSKPTTAQGNKLFETDT